MGRGNIYLVGMMGAGKTTLGRALAQRLRELQRGSRARWSAHALAREAKARRVEREDGGAAGASPGGADHFRLTSVSWYMCE